MNYFTELNQIGICVKDLDKAIANMKKVFGCAPSFVGETLKECRRYAGRDGNFSAKIALFDFCNIQFEFIMPLEGESIWHKFIEEHGEGIQHVSFKIADFSDAEKQMGEAGVEPVQQGLAMARPVRWDFWNTEELFGFSVESSSQMPSPKDHPKYPFD